jgi:glycosyl transferase, family 25
VEQLQLKTYVINLDKDKTRLEFLTSNFNRLGIAFERIAGVDGRTFSEEDYHAFMSDRPRKSKPWLRGQMGCFLSHYQAWKKIAEGEDRFCAVFEDDLHLSDDLTTILASNHWIPDDVDLIRLDTSTNRVRLTSEPVLTYSTRKLYGVKSTSWCAGGYLLHKRAAQKLLALPTQDHEPSDVILYNFEVSSIAKTLKILQFHPALCTQDKHLVKSNLRFSSNIEFPENQAPAWKIHLKKIAPSAIIKAIYRSLFGYKRIGFE